MLSRAITTENPLASTFFLSPERKAGNIETTSKSRGSYYLPDHLGSTRAVVDDQGTVLETFDYYPFGLLMPKRSSTAGNTLEKFTGKQRDEAIGLDYFGARYYDAALGRWHSVDPLADEMPSWSPYNYTFNNPIAFVDPDGQAPLDWIRNEETGEYVWYGNVTSESDTPEGFEYVGRFLSDVQKDFSDSTPFYNFWSSADINFSGWPGEISAKNPMDDVKQGYPGQGLPWFLDPSPAGKAKGVRGLLSAGDDIANAGGKIISSVTKKEEVFYRVFSGTNSQGRYLTKVKPNSSRHAIEGLSLPPWNKANYIQEVLVPAGTRLQRSRALPVSQWGRNRGGLEQFMLLDRIPTKNFGKGVPFK